MASLLPFNAHIVQFATLKHRSGTLQRVRLAQVRQAGTLPCHWGVPQGWGRPAPQYWLGSPGAGPSQPGRGDSEVETARRRSASGLGSEGSARQGLWDRATRKETHPCGTAHTRSGQPATRPQRSASAAAHRSSGRGTAATAHSGGESGSGEGQQAILTTQSA